MTHGTGQPSPIPPESISSGYELRDARPRGILLAAICFFTMLVLVHVVGWGVYVLLDQYQKAASDREFAPHPLSVAMPTVVPQPTLEPEPSRDFLPPADLEQVRAREQAQIGPQAWAWVDSAHRFARIPVQDAIHLAVKNGLPNVLPATQSTTQPFMPPASASHGPGGVP